MDKKEIKEWDDALLDLINKGLVEVVVMENGEKGFRLNLNCFDTTYKQME